MKNEINKQTTENKKIKTPNNKKKKYTKPTVDVHKIDKDVSLLLMSENGGGIGMDNLNAKKKPDIELTNQFEQNSFKTNPYEN